MCVVSVFVVCCARCAHSVCACCVCKHVVCACVCEWGGHAVCLCMCVHVFVQVCGGACVHERTHSVHTVCVPVVYMACTRVLFCAHSSCVSLCVVHVQLSAVTISPSWADLFFGAPYGKLVLDLGASDTGIHPLSLGPSPSMPAACGVGPLSRGKTMHQSPTLYGGLGGMGTIRWLSVWLSVLYPGDYNVRIGQLRLGVTLSFVNVPSSGTPTFRATGSLGCSALNGLGLRSLADCPLAHLSARRAPSHPSCPPAPSPNLPQAL